MSESLDLGAIREDYAPLAERNPGGTSWLVVALCDEVERLQQVGTHYFEEQKRLREALREIAAMQLQHTATTYPPLAVGWKCARIARNALSQEKG